MIAIAGVKPPTIPSAKLNVNPTPANLIGAEKSRTSKNGMNAVMQVIGMM